MVYNSGRSRLQDVNASTDPVVEGLGRLLVWVGALALVGSLVFGWLILSGLCAT